MCGDKDQRAGQADGNLELKGGRILGFFHCGLLVYEQTLRRIREKLISKQLTKESIISNRSAN